MARIDAGRLSALVDELMEVPEAERSEWLDARQELGADERAHIKRLLAAQNDFTLPPLPQYEGEIPVGNQDGPGAQIGPYRLVRPIGQGGMGAVWLAEREDGSFKRQVALKLPHDNRPQDQLAERFARERNILAALEHPHIARLYDAGVTVEGRPWLAMEFVAGEDILEYCRHRQLDLGARLRLFLQVTEALQYAHGHLVIHRDLKPGNILVTEEGQVRLLDFGIARLLQPDAAAGAAGSVATEFAGPALTPQYAAPEQIAGTAIGTAADLYALGVVLYELVTGAPPYRLKRNTRGALEEAILDAEIQPPSQAAQGRQPWAKQLRGDIDTILAKVLKKVPEDRYLTAAAFGMDIERHLAGKPVLASPDTATYRAGKFIRRHRWGVAAAVAAVLSLTAGLGAALWQARVAKEQEALARQQEAVAKKEAKTAQAVQGFLQGIFLANSAQQPDPAKARQTTARELLDMGAARLEQDLADEPEAKMRMLPMLSELYTQLGLFEKSAELADRHLALVRQTTGSDHPDTVEALIGFTLTQRMRWIDDPRQRTAMEEAIAILDRLGGGDPRYRAVALTVQAYVLSDWDFPRALALAREGMAIYRGLGSFNANASRAADLEYLAGNSEAAHRIADEGLQAGRALSEQSTDGRSGGYLHEPGLLDIQARAALLQYDPVRAQALAREAVDKADRLFEPGDPDRARARARLALALIAGGHKDEALALIAEAAATLPLNRPDERAHLRFIALAALGQAQTAAGLHADAAKTLAVALAMRDPDIAASPAIAELLRDLARAQAGLGHRIEAGKTLTRAITMRERAGIAPAAILRREREIAALIAPVASRAKQG